MTADGVIPRDLFYLLLGAAGIVAKQEQHRQYYATLLGVARVMAKKESQPDVERMIDQLAASATATLPIP